MCTRYREMVVSGCTFYRVSLEFVQPVVVCVAGCEWRWGIPLVMYQYCIQYLYIHWCMCRVINAFCCAAGHGASQGIPLACVVQSCVCSK